MPKRDTRVTKYLSECAPFARPYVKKGVVLIEKAR